MAQESNHRVNRVCSNFLRRKLIELIKLRALKLDWICAEVSAGYSSVAGGLKYGRKFSCFNGHQLAAFVLARRALGYGEKLNAKQLEQIPKRRRAHAKKIISSFHGHRHESLKPRPDTDGRMSGGDVKGVSVMTKRVTPHTAATSVLGINDAERRSHPALPGLSALLGGGCRGDEPRARGHGVNPPPAIGVKLGSVNKVNVI